MVAYELIEKIELIHSIDKVYRDIKPENIVIGSGLDT